MQKLVFFGRDLELLMISKHLVYALNNERKFKKKLS